MAGWPWPLDGVQRWFEDLWSWISTAARNAVAVVSDWIWTAVRWVQERISSGLDLVKGAVKGFVDGLWTSISGAFTALRSAVSTFVSNLWNNISGFLANLSNTLGSALSSLGSSVLGALGSVRDSLAAGVSGIVSVVSSAVGNAVNSLGSALNGAMSVVGSWLSDALAGVAKALGEALGGFVSWLSEKLGWLAQAITGVALAVRDAVLGFFDMVARGFIGMVTSIFSPGSPDPQVQKEAEAAFSSMIAQLEKATTLPKKSPVPIEALTTAIVSTCARFLVLKIGVEAAGAAVDAAHPIKGLKAHEIAAGIMGILDMPSVIGPVLSAPIEQGILIPWRQYWASRYTPQIPGAGDLIRFVVREVIDVNVFRENMGLQGFSTFWSDAFWEAHWVLPARGEIVDAFHRGVISAGELSKYLIWHDYKPEPRPGISKSDLEILSRIQKTPIGRVDLRRGYELGGLTKADLVERFRWLGYEDDAELIAEIQIRAALDAEIGKVRDNAKTDLVKGYILEADLRSTLKELGYGADVIEFHVQDALQDRERARKDLQVSTLQDAYVKEEIKTEDELAALLAEYIVDPELIDAMVTDAYVRRYKKPKAGAAA